MKYEIKKIKGLECLFVPMKDSNSTTVQILAKAGSIYETRETNGISHFLEHLFFKGGKKYKTPKEVAEAVDSFGGGFNAFTGEEYAGYYVKSAPEFVEKSIDVLGDMILNAQFPQAEMEREKGVVIQEIMMYEDNPPILVIDKWKNFFYGDNSYGRSTLGPVENIKKFTREDLIRHKNGLYTKDNLILVIAGKIENQKKLENIIADTFQNLPEKSSIEKPEFKNILPSKQKDFYSKKTEQNHLIISAKGFDGHDTKRYVANVLSTILGGNMSSRLFQNIREKQGLCYYINARHMSDSDSGVFIIRAGLEKGRFDFGLEKIYEELESIAKGDISKEDFEKAIGYNIGQVQMGIESSDNMADFMGSQYLLYGEIKTLDEILEIYRNMKLEDVLEITNKFKKENLYQYWIE
ncbi:MAG TPA: pitrilysin family protein [Candidatus Absconditabacterales bacterium]|nr:pitrilysin family protein [Candidatus Absconditabacterales bacterium]HPK27968.1 pitrilysin family protein [Candidatus Absconditabacterales bacterium]